MFYKLLIKIIAKKYKREAELILYMPKLREDLQVCIIKGRINPPSYRLFKAAQDYGIRADGMTTEQIIKKIIINEIK